jgi:hypothetical protein
MDDYIIVSWYIKVIGLLVAIPVILYFNWKKKSNGN